MIYQPLNSSVLDGYAYEENSEQLELFLRNGETRIFKGVPKETVIRLAKAKSAGRFYMTHIRSRYRPIKQQREKISVLGQHALPAGITL